MSKAHFLHYRYIAIKVEGAPKSSRRDLQVALTRIARKNQIPEDRLPNVTRFQLPHAIVRIQHMDLAAMREKIPSITSLGKTMDPVKITTILSSGTIKTITDRLGILTKR